MKNITLKIDDETYRRARLQAAARGTSVSAMVRDFLVHEAAAEEDRETRRIAALEELYRVTAEQAKPRSEPLTPLTRDEIYAERLR